ncbi:aminopeptidase C [Haloferula sp. A504]|uniref:aminopeptidase C n=1 Tax=Haloferula sp. A504 TaxID=3373601 RepID=UPI0031C723CC|nr:hypothetical protein [Verrucomicrobiaceae bacterium E54]
MSTSTASIAEAKSPEPESPSAGDLSTDFIAGLRKSFRLVEADRARQNAVAHNEIEDLALNHAALAGQDRHFSHEVRSRGVTNQQKSGRCWMFAALNTLRPHIIREHGMEEFEFSVAYLQFWDKLERANLFFEEVIEFRDRDYLDREWECLNQRAIHDGGWWNYAAALVGKYGAVPSEAMPETKSSSNTATLNKVLQRLVRSRAARMLERHADGAVLEELREMKNGALAEVYRLLVISLGEPPGEFRWRYVIRPEVPGENRKNDLETATTETLSPEETFTPMSFYQRFIGHSLDEFVCLYHDPKNEPGRHYLMDRARNVAGGECMGFVNVGIDTLKQVAIESILANESMWFAVNMGIDHSKKHGAMHDQLLDYETLFGIDLTLSKADRARFHEGASNHAMALVGVDLDADGQPRKWLAENSWGKEEVESGRWTLSDPWFDEHVYTIIVHRKHVPEAILERFNDEPVPLPAWYPG